MSSLTKEDYTMLKKTRKEALLNLLHMHVRNIWRVDGLYFLGIEERFGTEAATQIDTNCWRILGKFEARELKTILSLKRNDIPALVHALRNTSWSLHQEEKQTEVAPTKGIYKVTKCRVQETRLQKSLGIFPCKNVRFSYLKSFVEEFNKDIEVKCQVAPPEERPQGVWCLWEFTPRRRK